MANVTIIDSGFVSVTTSGTQFTGDNIVNSGSAIELTGISLTYTRSANNESNVEPDNTEDSPINAVSYNNPKIVISSLLKRGKLDGTGTSLDQVSLMDKLTTTKGIKCVYYNDTITSTSGYPLITKFLGTTDSETGHPSEPHFHVRFNNFTITQGTVNGMTFRLEGEITQ